MGTGGPHRQPEFPSRPAAAGEGGEVALLPAGRRRADGDREEERGSGWWGLTGSVGLEGL